jgi:hypothetical protein
MDDTNESADFGVCGTVAVLKPLKRGSAGMVGLCSLVALPLGAKVIGELGDCGPVLVLIVLKL